MKIVISEFMDAGAIEYLRERFDVLYDPEIVDAPDQLMSVLGGARGLIVRNRTKVTTDLLDAAPDLECVGRLGVGLDNIDLEACKSRGIAVFPATGANNLSVAEYVIAMAMTLLRNAYSANSAMIAGEWPRMACSGQEISGKTLGLVGFGAIAQETAAKARALGMSTIAHDPYLPQECEAWKDTVSCSLDEVLGRADVVSLHTPLTDATRHLIEERAFSKMQEHAVVINAARGGVLHDAAFADAVRAGKIGGGALDVFETEPLTAEAAQVFEGLKNVILTPHIAGVTSQSNVRVSRMIVDRVATHLSG